MAVLYRPCWIVAEVGVYDVRCERCKYFQAQVPGVPDRGRYLYEVRNTGAYALIRYRLPYHAVIRRMQEDHCLSLSLVISMIASGGPMKQIDMASHWAFVRACFSGVLYIDEVQDSGRTILFATDPLNNMTVSFKVVETDDQAHMNLF